MLGYRSGYGATGPRFGYTPERNPPPATPTTLLVIPGDTVNGLIWVDPPDEDLAGILVYRSLTSGSGYTLLDTVAPGVELYEDDGLTNGTTYYYILIAVDLAGKQSPPTEEKNGTPVDADAPAAPTSFAVQHGDGLNTLTWVDPADADLDSIRVYRTETSGTGYTIIAAVAPGVQTYVDEDVVNDTTYYYILIAVDEVPNSSTATPEESGTPRLPIWVNLLGGSGSYIASDDQLMRNTVGDLELVMRLNVPSAGNTTPKALLSNPDPYTFWFAVRASTGLELQNGNKATISGWAIFDQDVTLRVTRSGNTYTAWYRLADTDNWTLIGSQNATAGSGTTAITYLGAASAIGEDAWLGRLYYARMWVGGDASSGALRFDCDPSRDAASVASTSWTSATTGETWTLGAFAGLRQSLQIGDAIGGGYFAGIIDTIAGTIHGSDFYQLGKRYMLIAAPNALEVVVNTSRQWASSNQNLNDTKTRWEGLASTEAMQDANSAGSPYELAAYAATLAYPDDGGSPWYIPALDELELLYRMFKPGTGINATGNTSETFPGTFQHGTNPSSDPTGAAYTNGPPQNPVQTTIPGFGASEPQQYSVSTQTRISSSWANTTEAWSQDFGDGWQFGFAQTSTSGLRFRPVRRILIEEET